MPEPAVLDRLQPSLLERLTDKVRTLGIEAERASRALFAAFEADIEAAYERLAGRERSLPVRLDAAEAELLPPGLKERTAAVLELEVKARSGDADAASALPSAKEGLLAAWLDQRRNAYARLHDPGHRGGRQLLDADLALFGRLGEPLRRQLQEAVRLEQLHRFEPAQSRVLSLKELEASVLRNLDRLLNTEHLAATPAEGRRLPLDHYPRVARSVLNYGTPAIVGITLAGLGRDLEHGLATLIREAIVAFEPRLLADSVRVRVLTDPEQLERRQLRFEIEADLIAEPAPLHLLLNSVVDLEDGATTLQKDAG